MAWVETSSPSFTARHEAEPEKDAEAVLDALEAHRARLGKLYPRLPEDVTVILHDSWLQLALALPRLPAIGFSEPAVSVPPTRRKGLSRRGGNIGLSMVMVVGFLDGFLQPRRCQTGSREVETCESYRSVRF